MQLCLEDSSTQAQPPQEMSLEQQFKIKGELGVLAGAFIQAFKQQDPWTMTDLAQGIRKITSKTKDSFIQSLIDIGVVIYLIKIFSKNFFQRTRLLMECSWIIVNISASDPKYVCYIVELDIISKILPFLKHPDIEIRRNVVWVLANLTREPLNYVENMFKGGLIKELDYMLKSFALKKYIIKEVAWLICKLSKRSHPRNVMAPLVKHLGSFLKRFSDPKITLHTLWSLSNFSETGEREIQQVLDLNICPKLIKLMKSENSDIKKAAFGIIANLVLGNITQTNEALANGAIEAFAEFLDCSDDKTLKEVCWAFSNILAGTQPQVEAVRLYNEGEIIRKFIEMIPTKNAEIVKECMWCIHNMCTSGSVYQLAWLVRQNIIPILVNALKKEDPEAQYLVLCMESMRYIMNSLSAVFDDIEGINRDYVRKKIEEYGGVEVMEKLKTHSDRQVYETVTKMFQDIFAYD